MPSIIQYPLINGVRHSWSSVEIAVAGLTIGGIQEINYSVKLDAAYVRGQGPNPIGYTTGLSSYTGDITMLLAEFDQLMATLGKLGAGSMTSIFDVSVSHTNEGYLLGGMATITDTLKCRITEVSAAASNSSGDALVRKLTLLPLSMLLNGVSPVPNMPSLSLGGVAGAASGVIQRVLSI